VSPTRPTRSCATFRLRFCSTGRSRHEEKRHRNECRYNRCCRRDPTTTQRCIHSVPPTGGGAGSTLDAPFGCSWLSLPFWRHQLCGCCSRRLNGYHHCRLAWPLTRRGIRLRQGTVPKLALRACPGWTGTMDSRVRCQAAPSPRPATDLTS